MKINAKLFICLISTGYIIQQVTSKYRSSIMDENHFIALIFTQWASRQKQKAV
jgi:hypothetical protein